jgi:hypothetical protein
MVTDNSSSWKSHISDPQSISSSFNEYFAAVVEIVFLMKILIRVKLSAIYVIALEILFSVLTVNLHLTAKLKILTKSEEFQCLWI